MGKIFKNLAKILILLNLSCGAKAIEFEVPQGNISYILDSNKQTAKVYKIYKDKEDSITLDIPAFVEFGTQYYKVTSLAKGCISPYTSKLINKVYIPYTLSKSENNKEILFNLLSSSNLSKADKFTIEDYFNDSFEKKLKSKEKNDPLKIAISRYERMS